MEDKVFSRPSVSPVSKLEQRHAGRLRKRDNLLTEERGEGDGVGTKPYDRNKVWYSIDHSILFVAIYCYFLERLAVGLGPPTSLYRILGKARVEFLKAALKNFVDTSRKLLL